MKHKEIAKVISQESIATGVYSMWIQTKDIAAKAVAGQFISVYCKDGAKLLPRPISICEVNKEEGTLRIVYRVVGGGTTEMSGYAKRRQKSDSYRRRYRYTSNGSVRKRIKRNRRSSDSCRI